MALRTNALRPDPPAMAWEVADGPATRLTPARQRVLAELAAGPLGSTALREAAGVGGAVIRGMADAGLLRPVVLRSGRIFGEPDCRGEGPALSAEQQAAASALRAAVAGGFSVTLLDGVTGSGKTEVYLEAVAECLRCGRQALVLLPEIALSAQWLDRFARAVRLRAGCLALRPAGPHPPHHLAGGRRRRGSGRGGRPFRLVPAVPRSRPDRRGRGTRDRLQAGGRRRLSRPRHGDRARPAVRRPGGAGLRHAEPGDARQCRGRPLRPPEAADPAWRRAPAGREPAGHARTPAGARPLPGRSAGRARRARRWRAASRRCCSSTAAAMRR